MARRVRSAAHVAEHALTGKGRARAVRYAPHALDEAVFLHPRSALARAAPELVAYAELVRTDKRPYMAGAHSARSMLRLDQLRQPSVETPSASIMRPCVPLLPASSPPPPLQEAALRALTRFFGWPFLLFTFVDHAHLGPHRAPQEEAQEPYAGVTAPEK